MTLSDRLMAKVSEEPNSGCFLWMGKVDRHGYGRAWDGKREGFAHRMLYELTHGPVAKGLELDHLCRVPCCINPRHLEPVTHRENLRRSPIANGHQTHCPAGHPYNEENTHYRARGSRDCRVCGRLAAQRKRAAKCSLPKQKAHTGK